MEDDSPAADAEVVRFRSSKKRKAYRQRPADADTTNHDEEATPAAEATADDTAVQAALKLRNARRGRLQGVTFKADDARIEDDDDDLALMLRQESEIAKGIPDRFMHQTGLAAELNDKHMAQYIESRLASRNAPPTETTPAEEAKTAAQAAAAQAAAVTRQPASQGKLLEVDLSEIAISSRNKRPHGGQQAGSEKPKRRNRNRRGSEDVKRDQLVEAFLHENRLDVYEVPAARAEPVGDSTSADDKLAEQFQQQYMDEMALRRQKRRPAINQPRGAPAGQQQGEDVLRGPKLGGSRNVRSAVRDALLVEQEKSRKK